MINMGSVKRGIKAMTKDHAKVNYEISFGKSKRIWCDAWTPVWHEGRGPYITMGFLFIRFLRGY